MAGKKKTTVTKPPKSPKLPTQREAYTTLVQALEREGQEQTEILKRLTDHSTILFRVGIEDEMAALTASRGRQDQLFVALKMLLPLPKEKDEYDA